jgi:hypothetical protein
MNRAFITHVDQVLAPIGFQRAKAIWRRRVTSFVDVIDIQVSKGHGSVTLNAGVLDPEIYTYCWASEAPSRPETPDCTVQARVGELASDRRDVWWSIDVPSTPTELSEAVTERLIPFVDRMHSRKTMIDWLEERRVVNRRYPPPIIYLAVLRFLSGEPDASCEILRGLYAKSAGPWRERVGEILTQLECTTDGP